MYETILEVLTAAGETFSGGPSAVAGIAEDWADHDFDVDQVQQWVDAGCWDASTAAELRQAGFRPGKDELAYRPNCERDDMDAMYALCNADVSLEKVAW